MSLPAVGDGQNLNLEPTFVHRLEPFSARIKSVSRFFTLRALDVQLHRVCDDLSGVLLLPMLIFSPWAFGTTQPWSIWCMNLGGYALGILLLAKLFIRKAKGYPAPRWDRFSSRSGTLSRHRHPATRLLTRTLAALTLAVLAEILISALNVAANYNSETLLPVYHRHLGWLPHSMDGGRTWLHFWMYLGLAGAFWAVCDWLAGMTSTEERTFLTGTNNSVEKTVPLLPARLRTLLWVLCINGAFLGVEAIVQRAAGSTKLLFLVQPRVNPEGLSQFGPYAYRANAAQYFNMVWPLCLGFWWTLQRTGGLHGKSRHWLLLCATIMAACPEQIGECYQIRNEMYLGAEAMAKDYPLFGTGAGTFATVFQLYRYSTDTYWPEQLHNDWLETRITFGWLGFLLLLAALACVGLRWFVPGGIRGSRRLVVLAWLGLGGCLIHALFDFPFQIHSTLFLFLVICAILFGLSRNPSGARR